ncbi:MAG: plastocyanin/azurin family copper-binding protein [Saprospiraceae bacterium]
MKKQLLIALALVLAAIYGQAQDHTITISGLSFSPGNLTINIGETVQWQNNSGSHNVNGSLATYPSNPAGFFSGNAAPAPWTFNHTFTIPGTYEYRCDPHFLAGMTGMITVLEPQNYPIYDIGTVTTSNADGVVDSLGVSCQLEGIVYGIDYRGGNGVQFFMRDNTGGIGVFSTGINYYTVTEGDQIIVRGDIGQFNGLNQIAPDTIILVSTGNALVAPTVVTALDESTEAELVRINDVYLVDPAQWTGTGAGFNVDLTDGVNTYIMRIDNDCDLFGTAAPADTFDVIGLGYQFDSSLPYTSGHQLYPRYTQDIIGGSVNPNQFPPYPIGLVTTVNASGEVDSLNVKCELKGIVTSGDLNGGGSIQFFFQDATGGISMFSSDNFGYTVQEGDEVVVRGTIVAFNCLSQITPETLFVASTGNQLPTPVVVIGPLTEAHEGELIQINNLTLVDPGQWTGSGAGFNVDVTDGVNTYQMRIDNDVDLYSLPAPSGTFNAIGIGGQFDNSAPCEGGYQFLPRSVEDIISTSVYDRALSAQVKVYPNPAQQVLFIQTDLQVEQWMVANLLGQQILFQSAANGQVDISGLKPGAYILQGVLENGKRVSRLFSVQ